MPGFEGQRQRGSAVKPAYEVKRGLTAEGGRYTEKRASANDGWGIKGASLKKPPLSLFEFQRKKASPAMERGNRVMEATHGFPRCLDRPAAGLPRQAEWFSHRLGWLTGLAPGRGKLDRPDLRQT